MEPNGTGSAKIPARVFPGIFDEEFQVTVRIGQQEVSSNVAGDFVVVEGKPGEDGIDGFLKIDIVDDTGDAFVVVLPGEVEGLPSRVSVPKEMVSRAA